MIDHISFIALIGGIVLLLKTLAHMDFQITHIDVLLSISQRERINPFLPGEKMDVGTLTLSDDAVQDRRLDSISHCHIRKLLILRTIPPSPT